MLDISEDEIDIEFEDNKDFVRLILTPHHQERIPFYVDIFNGYCDFFIGNGNEVLLQYKFKSPQEAKKYFGKFLSSPVVYSESKTTKGSLAKSEYRLMHSEGDELLSGDKGFRIGKLKRTEKVFEPWINK